MTALLLYPKFGWLLFYFCLGALARTSCTVLNNSGESEHPCLVPDLRRQTCSFSLLSTLGEGLSYMAFIVLK